MRIALISIESKKHLWFDKAAFEYNQKIGHLARFEHIQLKSSTLKESASLSRDKASLKVNLESDLISKRFKSDDFVIICDEEGEEKDSLEMSQKIQKIMLSGKKRVLFVVGGAFGLSSDLKSKAHLKVKLSSMTLNHLVAQVVVLEQIYRALTIWKGLPYHNE